MVMSNVLQYIVNISIIKALSYYKKMKLYLTLNYPVEFYQLLISLYATMQYRATVRKCDSLHNNAV